MYEYLIRDLRDPNKPIDCNEVADAIEKLIEERDAAYHVGHQISEKLPVWISVEERLPEKSGHYLAVINGATGEAYYGHESQIWLDPSEEWDDWTRFVTHWMQLPTPPKEETE